MTSNIKKLFNSYQLAFNQFDAEAIAAHYVLPCLISDVDGQSSYCSLKQLNEKFMINCKKMRDMGFVGSEFSLGNIEGFGNNFVSVDIA